MRWSLVLLAACGVGDDVPVEAGDTDTIDAVGRCDYVNPFSQADECKEYLGAGWTATTAADDCAAPIPGAEPGAFTEASLCDRGSILGECVIAPETDDHTVLVFPGEYDDSCDGLDIGCSFAGGDFYPAPQCGEQGGGGEAGSVFRPFEQVCVDALPGEPEGLTDGQVCTWQAISGATEPGRYFPDYADCSVVRTQRPYWAATATADTAADDPRLSDVDWKAEYDWVTEQVRATACTCCHSSLEAPAGPSGWYLEADPIWTDTLEDDGMAMLAGWIDSTAFGAFHPDDNNGFARDVAGVPTTDSFRMRDFFVGELARRGLQRSDFASAEPFGGPLYDQLVFEPEACPDDVGLNADGTLSWTGGDARYVYILERDANPPGVPPNLDLPDGTLWRMDVAHTEDPVASGLGYGSVPAGAVQAFPAEGDAPPLRSGRTYFLYVLADVYQPLTRCLFEAP